MLPQLRSEKGKLNWLWVVRDEVTIKVRVPLDTFSMKVKMSIYARFVLSGSGWKVMVSCVIHNHK